MALDASLSAMAINQACDDWVNDSSAACRRTQFVQTGRLGGSLIGGFGGGIVAYSACALVFGIPSVGSSFVWCAVVAGGAGAIGGGIGAGALGETAARIVYDTVSGAP